MAIQPYERAFSQERASSSYNYGNSETAGRPKERCLSIRRPALSNVRGKEGGEGDVRMGARFIWNESHRETEPPATITAPEIIGCAYDAEPRLPRAIRPN